MFEILNNFSAKLLESLLGAETPESEFLEK